MWNLMMQSTAELQLLSKVGNEGLVPVHWTEFPPVAPLVVPAELELPVDPSSVEPLQAATRSMTTVQSEREAARMQRA
jgi:hypothetical protein